MELIDIFARGGGGGSGGGGGGGGGGSGGGGSGSGGPGGLFIFWGWFIAQVCGWCMRFSKPYNYISAYTFAAAAVVVSLKFPLGGVFAGAAIIGAFYGITGRLEGLYKYAKRKVLARLKKAAKDDIQWDWKLVQPEISKLFLKFQQDWSEFNFESMKTYMTLPYFNRTQLLLAAMKQLGRQNRMFDVKILDMRPAHFTDVLDDSNDRLSVVVMAKARDELWEGQDKLYADKSSFLEEWQFVRDPSDKMWLLDNIVQRGTQTPYSESSKLLEFANKNHFVYSGDFGWLLLPKRGQLFSRATFKNSDINSHVIGIYRKVLVQFYSYIKSKNQTSGAQTIAQATVPKNYGNIVVRRKTWWRFWTPGKLTRVVPEWGDFNKKYDVFASDIERVTSLELLHPAFMVKLEALPFKTSIEVVDNNVYFYTDDRKADYQLMLNLLHEAFDEMRL